MPTGLTADVCTGKVTEFPQFAMSCARMIGYLIVMRDEPWDAPIPVFKPDPMQLEWQKEAEKKLAKLQAMSDAECQAEVDRINLQRKKEREDYLKEGHAVRDRLLAMRAKVADWTPPTAEHEELKKLMIQQLDHTIESDGNPEETLKYMNGPITLTGAQWKDREIKGAMEDIVEHGKHYKDEVDRTERRNRWVAALRKSLGIAT